MHGRVLDLPRVPETQTRVNDIDPVFVVTHGEREGREEERERKDFIPGFNQRSSLSSSRLWLLRSSHAGYGGARSA